MADKIGLQTEIELLSALERREVVTQPAGGPMNRWYAVHARPQQKRRVEAISCAKGFRVRLPACP